MTSIFLCTYIGFAIGFIGLRLLKGEDVLERVVIVLIIGVILLLVAAQIYFRGYWQ